MGFRRWSAAIFALSIFWVPAEAVPLRYTFDGQVGQDLVYGSAPGDTFSVSIVMDSALPRDIRYTSPTNYSGSFDPAAISSVTLNVNGRAHDYGRTWLAHFQYTSYTECQWCTPTTAYEAAHVVTAPPISAPHSAFFEFGGLSDNPSVPPEEFSTLSLDQYLTRLPGAHFVEWGETVGNSTSSVFGGNLFHVTVSGVPEPSALLLMLAGCGWLMIRDRKEGWGRPS